ncbi:hypothetical protein [Streptomyces roseoverticillatus]|uniref:Uncharacterized protein n=1 Tax=Streptomyces roseoverticillatus TaxID=66429 RepID=A0ABV3IMC5_9ACTN
MTRVGCTGHQNLSGATRREVARLIADRLTRLPGDGLVGLTSLAEGSDQAFAFAVLAAGGELCAIVPSDRYESAFQSPGAAAVYRQLLGLAAERVVLPFTDPGEDAYLAAGQRVVEDSDVLLAVWDGREAGGVGGTADIVAYARKRGVETHVIWPPGARRA